MASVFPTDYRGWLAKLIAFNTVSRNSNLPLIHYVRDYLKTVGIESTLVHNPDKTKANLWATLPGENGATKGGLVLSGHTDVVPTDGQKWDTDPFTMVEKDGKLYGRGSCDMKGFIAVVLSLTPTFLKMRRAKPIHYAFSFDEELGCVGVPFLIDVLREKQFSADACVIGEPTEMKVVTGNKGHYGWQVDVHGKPIHSSAALMDTSCNAIEYASQIIIKIRKLAKELRANGPRDEQYGCPFPCMNTAIIDSTNKATNTVPDQCSFSFSVRVAEEETPKKVFREVDGYVQSNILPNMRAEYEGSRVDMSELAHYPPFNGSEESSITKCARKLCNDTTVRKMSAGTEAGYFSSSLSIPTIILGPGSLEECAHKPNEYVTVEDMEKCYFTTIEITKFICC